MPHVCKGVLMQVLYSRCAGLDVHKDTGLLALADWLRRSNVGSCDVSPLVFLIGPRCRGPWSVNAKTGCHEYPAPSPPFDDIDVRALTKILSNQSEVARCHLSSSGLVRVHAIL